MKKKKRGMTLVEVVISMTLGTVILGIVGTFFLANSEINANTYVKSDLQSEAQDIQNTVMNFALQTKEVSKVILQDGQSSNSIDNKKDVVYSKLNADNNGMVQISEISMVTLEEDDSGSIKEVNYTLKYDKDAKTLTVQKEDGQERELSNNVESLEIKPVDENKSFMECHSISINITLSERKPQVKDEMAKVSTNMVIAFRNKEERGKYK